MELHGFGGASPKAYGSCVYLKAKLTNGSSVTSVVLAKSKMQPPLKKIALPRLELLGAVLCTRLIVFVRKALRLPDIVQHRCWTDPMLVLTWIMSDSSRWKECVANRSADIQSLVAPDQWSHCSGDNNAADLLIRSVSAQELLGSEMCYMDHLSC